MICVSSESSNWKTTLETAIKYDYYCAIGIHPYRVQEIYDEDPTLYYQNIEKELALLQQFFKEHQHEVGKHIKAVGELGLSALDDQLLRLQMKVVQKQFDMALKLGLPVVVHAHRQMQLQLIIDLLQEHQSEYKSLKLHIHGFSCEPKHMLALLQTNDCVMGANLIILKQCGTFIKTVKKVGLEKLVLETDSPFVPIGDETRKSGPGDIELVLQRLSEQLGINIDQLNAQVNKNAARFYGVDI